MTKLDTLLQAQPTSSEYQSQAIVMEIFHRTDWRCYSTTTRDDVTKLIERFLKSHARLPGLFSPETYTNEPAGVFYWEDEEGAVHRGGLYLNGAVLVVRRAGEPDHYSFFIDDGTADRWGYPKDGHVYLGRILEANIQQVRKEEEEKQ